MGLRETLNKQGPAAKVSVIGVLVLLIGLSFWNSLSSGKPHNATEAYYTTDDGQTTFTDDFFRSYPFDHDGKPAVRAYMYQTGKGTKFVGYLERYTDEGIKTLEPLLAQSGNREQLRDPIQAVRLRYTEIKKPNDSSARWYRVGSAQAESVEAAKSPDGPSDNWILVFP